MVKITGLRLYRSQCCEWHICCGSKKEKEKKNVTSASLFAAVCFGSGTGAGDTDRLNKLIQRARSVLRPFEEVAEWRKLNKLLSITDDPQYLLHLLLVDGQRSSFSSRQITGSTSGNHSCSELFTLLNRTILLCSFCTMTFCIICVCIVTCMYTFIPFLPFIAISSFKSIMDAQYSFSFILI